MDDYSIRRTLLQLYDVRDIKRALDVNKERRHILSSRSFWFEKYVLDGFPEGAYLLANKPQSFLGPKDALDLYRYRFDYQISKPSVDYRKLESVSQLLDLARAYEQFCNDVIGSIGVTVLYNVKPKDILYDLLHKSVGSKGQPFPFYSIARYRKESELVTSVEVYGYDIYDGLTMRPRRHPGIVTRLAPNPPSNIDNVIRWLAWLISNRINEGTQPEETRWEGRIDKGLPAFSYLAPFGSVLSYPSK